MIDDKTKNFIKEKLKSVIEKYCLFEENNKNTRQCVVRQMEYFLDMYGIGDTIVICDETNNTDDIIDGHGFICEIVCNNGDGTFLTIKEKVECADDLV